ncbi:G/T mismatch-specific thymine DNA glycosylase-like isoform X2 [Nylanderia fulva]|nr:G/T mismatch-specific thymine DNA glycosylase-like isoform X2 [Nylanderia fulva]XP_029157440.1 G/T mismatch-specific thymine DNA glycosylase-like isoform X2 [Nylanderia fulva]XP_029157441.1 G/T mismatch-specific thymine DNA glycosylase-like isoform X2 [Nylanderia fulva]XP_029157442.1 G/T mismatch-specific thymine DNA glycosylase-like isoform X2 [Nylanderia fulva]
MSSLDLNKLKRRKPEVSERPKKKIDRFDGLSEEEVQKFTLDDYLEMNLDLVFVGINPSLMAAHRGRYYAGPGNHFYKLLHESGLTPRFVSFEEDYKLLQYSIGLTNIVTRPTRSAADLKRTEIKEGAKVVEEKLRLYKPKIAVFNGKCIYEVFANIRANSKFYFGLQPECIGDTVIWVTPSSSARCANFPRMVDKLHFYTALKKYLQFLKGEITDVDVKEFQFEGKCKQSVPSTSKMWRRKNISTFLHGGRVVNKNTLCLDTSEEDIAAIHTAEFLVEKANQKMYNEDEDKCNYENKNRALFDKITVKTEKDMKKIEKIVISSDVNNETVIANRSKKETSNVNRKESSNHVNNTINDESITSEKNEKCTSSKITRKTSETRNNFKNSNRSNSLDFMSLIKQRLSQKNNTSTTSELESS